MRDRTEHLPRPTGHRQAGLRRAVPVAAAVAVGLLTAGVVAPPAPAAPRPGTVQQRLTALVRDDGLPAALASVTDRAGRTRTYTAGVGDLSNGAKVPGDGQVRIGSNTKTFTAVVVLQLAGEGRIALDATVDTYLPGLVRGEGIDGRLVTVRQLLQHTSGLPEYESYVDDAILQHRYLEPRDILDIALRQKADFAPGAKFGYSSTNYLLAGLIVQKVTGRPLAEEVDKRVIRRIGLRHTYFPAPGDMTIREPHPQGYRWDAAGAPPRDATELDPSPAWAAGQMISTNADLDRFFTALLGGRLLPAAQLAQMRATVPVGDSGAGYGLGIISRPLSCGGVYWGHGGDIPGYESRGGATEDGRAANITVTGIPSDYAVTERLEAAVDAALCS
ncbi:serine hydrolase domain-containing protein [Kitasatospora indigofera]|uniref:serine hydrolase domain-containing protein n=1 Tax=Kitasatospora indigofera TaxID=67307 RepID=UPI003630E9DD